MSELTVVKFGSELVTREQGVDQAALNLYATLLTEEYAAGELVVVTSGAVKAGRLVVEQAGRDFEDFSETTLAQVGGPIVMTAWQRAFLRANRLAGELLVTHNELNDVTEGSLFKEALKFDLAAGVIPIVNANDALSRDELMRLSRAEDNDGLALHIAKLLSADSLVIFTADGGIVDDEGELLAQVDDLNVDYVRQILTARLECETKKPKGDGKGGILSKFNVARDAAELGLRASIQMPSTDEDKRKTTNFVLG